MKRIDHRAPALRPAKKEVARIAGLPAVAALFKAAPERVERLFFEDRARASVAPFCAALARVHKPFRLVGTDELDRIAGTMLHGGIVAIARAQPIHPFDPEAAAQWAHDRQPLLILDGVSNPHNLGAIARTAAFFGLPRMVLSDHPSQAGPSDASYRVAEGGLEYVELYRSVRFTQALQRLRRSYRVIGTAAGKGQPLDAALESEKALALVLGNEEHGLPHATLAACDAIVTIPGAGFVQSLNVAASAAILLHALRK